MKKRKRDTRYVSVLTVFVPGLDAVIDMLRYDNCVPDSQEDSRKLGVIGFGLTDRPPQDHIVRFRRFAGADTEPTTGRWESFGCFVIDERPALDTPMNDVDALNAFTFGQASRMPFARRTS